MADAPPPRLVAAERKSPTPSRLPGSLVVNNPANKRRTLVRTALLRQQQVLAMCIMAHVGFC